MLTNQRQNYPEMSFFHPLHEDKSNCEEDEPHLVPILFSQTRLFLSSWSCFPLLGFLPLFSCLVEFLVFLSFSWLSPFLLSCRRPSALLSSHPLHFYAHLQLQNGTSSTSMELRMSRGQNRSEDQTSSTSWRMRNT